jgi:hypothetical protein
MLVLVIFGFLLPVRSVAAQTPTPTVPELLGVGEELSWFAVLWERFGWGVMLFVLGAAVLIFLRTFVQRIVRWIASLGEQLAEIIGSRFWQIITWRRVPKPLRRYLKQLDLWKPPRDWRGD